MYDSHQHHHQHLYQVPAHVPKSLDFASGLGNLTLVVCLLLFIYQCSHLGLRGHVPKKGHGLGEFGPWGQGKKMKDM